MTLAEIVGEGTLAPDGQPMSISELFPQYRFESMGAETRESAIIKCVLERGT